ncbi:hypothetical protein BGW42_002738 [Actinomortierella wolfii]|nr:hypothetical protein BGW41_005062 [Actinomortierella wolfii]KAG0227719.1 hypothetical protein BGW42_002738 [Actinomortierella wolfii]
MPKVKTPTTAARSGASKKDAPVAPASTKKMSAYNQFMKTELPKYKAKHPELSHKEAFKEVAQMWKTSPANPNKA